MRMTHEIFPIKKLLPIFIGAMSTLPHEAALAENFPPPLHSSQIIITIDDNSASPPQRGYHARDYRVSPLTAQIIAGLERDYALQKIDGWPLRVLEKYCAVMAVNADIDAASLLQRLQHDTRISLAQPLQLFETRGEPAQQDVPQNTALPVGYNDPYFSQQYGRLADTILRLHQHATGRNVRVAVIDTGADRQHPDLQNIRQTRDFVGSSAVFDNKSAFDNELHGTAIAGIIAASANNHIGIVGLAPDAKVSILKACWQLEAGIIAARCNTLTLAKALSFAIEEGDNIINLSLGGPADPLLTQLVQAALAHGILIVAARDARDIFPAMIPGVLGVDAAVDNKELLAHADPDTNLIIAGASELLSTSPGGHYDFFSGSSMAAARVTGLAALMKQEQQQLTSAQLFDNLNRWLASASAIASSH